MSGTGKGMADGAWQVRLNLRVLALPNNALELVPKAQIEPGSL